MSKGVDLKSTDFDMHWADPASLRANPWNTNEVSAENEKKLDASILRFGMFRPIIARQLSDGALEIIGGEHRAKRAAELGMKSVPVINLGANITDKQAKEIGLADNARYGHDDTLALAELMNSLDFDLAGFLPYTEEDLNIIFSSADIDLDGLGFDEEESSEPLPDPVRPVQTHQIMRFKVPVEDAHKVSEIIERIIKEQGFSSSDSLTNAGDALVHLLCQER